MQVRVLHIAMMEELGGIENLLMTIYRKIDKDKIQFDFLVPREDRGMFDEEIERLGGRIYTIPNMKKVGYWEYKKILYNFFKKHPEYKIVHCHRDALCSIYLRQAKKTGVPIRIAHSHTIKLVAPKTLQGKLSIVIKQYFRYLTTQYATEYFACSKEAGEWLFGKKISEKKINILKNGIDLNKYVYLDILRKKVRENLGIEEETILLGHVGSFTLPKNHEFIIDIFESLKKEFRSIKLVLVGYGELETCIKNKVKKINLQEDVMFLGKRTDVNELMMGMDIFIFPSLFEGLGIALIEAQATGIRCIASNNIPKEADMGIDLIKYMDIEDSSKWVQEISKYIKDRSEKRISNLDKIRLKGYDINQNILEIEKIYLK